MRPAFLNGRDVIILVRALMVMRIGILLMWVRVLIV